MPARIFEDDYRNQSSFRVVWVPFMWALTIIIAFMAGLYIRELLMDGEDVARWLSGLKVTGGTGIGGFVLATIRKWVEGLRRPIQPQQSNETLRPTVTEPSLTPPDIVPGLHYEIVVDRIYETNKKTLGDAGVWNGVSYVYKFKTIELPWQDNVRYISRIPAGLYDAVAIRRNKDGKYAIQLNDVPNRTAIQFHIANYFRDLLGCFGPGISFKDIDNDGYLDVQNSKVVMDKLQEFFPLGTSLRVRVRDSFHLSGNIKPL